MYISWMGEMGSEIMCSGKRFMLIAVPVWHSTDSGLEMPSDHESIIKVCKYHKTTFS